VTAAAELPAPEVDRTGEMLAAILHIANQVGAVHGIHAIGDTVIITAATGRDRDAIADEILNGHHTGDCEGVFAVHDLPAGPDSAVHLLHVRIVRDVL
jgi:hypothetical protein